ncbi:hypothetical protein K6V98_02665 [Collinsella sp. AGMB00827]|uniref:MFS transporter n=1 Tax=Collinsella ureilytica TaxID=2869515 RepID=A0ABS7MIS1_9ACTN|nr:Rnf-Nqr domain containing protein [Collinsella urealyticum]MBY4797268.1 hypothetical protein [Collinsella urealyticum]
MALHPDLVAQQDRRIAELVYSRAFLIVAGALPGVAVARSLETGLAIGAVSAIAIVSAALIAPCADRIAGRTARLAIGLMINAALMVLVGFAVRIMVPAIYRDLGFYLPLCAASGMASVFLAQREFVPGQIEHDPDTTSLNRLSFADACIAALGSLVSLALAGALSGLLATGVVAGIEVPFLMAAPLSIFAKPAGSYLILAAIAALIQAVCPGKTHVQGGDRA